MTKKIPINSIIVGDCRERMKQIPDESVDLIYLDPPFFSSRQYNLIWGEKDSEATIKAFEDAKLYKKVCGKCNRSWRVNPKTGEYYATCRDGCKGRLKDTKSVPMNVPEVFTEWLKEAIQQCKRVLKPTGLIYCHLDRHVIHYVKVMMDELFGYDNFKNEIIWKRSSGSGGKSAGGMFTPNHDTIIVYSKSGSGVTYNQLFHPLTDEWIDKNSFTHDGELWYWSHYGRKEKKLVSEKKGIRIDDIWTDIPSINEGVRGKKERLGYPTQKPEALLERIILASSDVGDIVLDPFCGCGTAIVVAQRFDRKWIGIDIEPLSCTVMQTRMQNEFGIDVPLIDLEKTLTEDEAVAIIQQSHKMDAFEFQDWVVKVLGGKPNSTRSGDGGIDGWIDKPFGDLKKGDPIQVKMSAKVGDPVVRLFAFDTMNEGRDHGVIVAYSFSGTAEKTAKEIREQHGIEIWLMTVKDMLVMTSKKNVKKAHKHQRGVQAKLQ
jgi:DNA modification methylase